MRRRGFAVVVGVALVLAVAVVWVVLETGSREGDVEADGDPQPQISGEGVTVGADGGRFVFGEVELRVPAGAVDDNEPLTILPMQPIGESRGEVFGQPAGIDYDEVLSRPVTVRWNVSDLSQRQRATLLLARWDAETGAWQRMPVPFEVDDNGGLVAEISEFSFWTWVANKGQSIGEIIGTRADAPQCSDEPLPTWVRDVGDPDQGTNAAAIRVCFEPDRDQIVTVRVVNNRTFSQRLHLSRGEQWAWTWPGAVKQDVSGVVYQVAHDVLDTDTEYLLPPLTEVAVGIGRPAGSGARTITATADVDVVSVLVDVTTYVLEQVPVGVWTIP